MTTAELEMSRKIYDGICGLLSQTEFPMTKTFEEWLAEETAEWLKEEAAE